MLDRYFPTIDPADPYRLTAEENASWNALRPRFRIVKSFSSICGFFWQREACIRYIIKTSSITAAFPFVRTEASKETSVYGKCYKGRGLYDVLESYIRRGFMAEDETERKRGRDIMWYIWLGENSPLFGKDKNGYF